jgi:hypothetical protein
VTFDHGVVERMTAAALAGAIAARAALASVRCSF